MNLHPSLSRFSTILHHPLQELLQLFGFYVTPIFINRGEPSPTNYYN